MASPSFDVIVVGNGIIGLAIASGLQAQGAGRICVVGPKHRPFCASMAAAAMLNCFAELEPNALNEPRDQIKFQASIKSAKLWDTFLEETNVPASFKRMGTVVIQNTAADGLDDKNFSAILNYALQYKEPVEFIEPGMISGYNPSPHHRALKALLLKNEGWVNPDGVISSLEKNLCEKGVKFYDDTVKNLSTTENKSLTIELQNGESLSGGRFVVANGSHASVLCKNSGIDIVMVIHGVGCTIVLESESISCDHVIRTPNRGGACGVYHAPYNPGTIVVGASNLITTNPQPHARIVSVAGLMNGAMEQINSAHAKSTLLRVNVGYRPTSLDVYPVIGRVNDNTYVITGTKRDGYHFAPYYSKYCSEDILNGFTNEKFIKHCDPFRKLYSHGTVSECAEKYAEHKLSALAQHGYRSGHESSRTDLYQSYVSKVLEYFLRNNLQKGVAVEMVEPLLAGHILPGCFNDSL